MKNQFEVHYKSIEDEHTLLTQLTQIKKEPSVPMREFIIKFNKLVNRILVARIPTIDNHKMLFIISMAPNISFQIRCVHLANIQDAQTIVIELEEDLIVAGK